MTTALSRISHECIEDDLHDEQRSDTEFLRAIQVGDKQTTPIIDESALQQIERFGHLYKD